MLAGLFRYIWVMGQRGCTICPYPALCRPDSTFYIYLELHSERQPHCVGKVLFDLHKSDTIWFTACNIWVVAKVAESFRKPRLKEKFLVVDHTRTWSCKQQAALLRHELPLPKRSDHWQVPGIHCLCYRNSGLTTGSPLQTKFTKQTFGTQDSVCICRLPVFENVFNCAFKPLIFLMTSS